MTTDPVAVRLSQVSRTFGTVKALNSINLEIQDGEFFSLLGPSGSGKTTCLRLIAGFEQPSQGSIQLFGQEAAGIPPFHRDVNTVFQDYALFPHMTVAENIGYGLMIKKIPPAQRRRQVEEMLELVRLPGLGERKPAQLSGGQRQRVAVARALINHPRILLLDEPLGALDLKLRQQMQTELKTIQQQVGITFIYVTHDQEEALTMSDRIAVFNLGQIEQIGTPTHIYEHPQTAFVAGFVGTCNVISGSLAQRLLGAEGPYFLRPEKIRLMAANDPVAPDWGSVLGQIREALYLGMYSRYQVELEGGGELTVVEQNADNVARHLAPRRGLSVRLAWRLPLLVR